MISETAEQSTEQVVEKISETPIEKCDNCGEYKPDKKHRLGHIIAVASTKSVLGHKQNWAFGSGCSGDFSIKACLAFEMIKCDVAITHRDMVIKYISDYCITSFKDEDWKVKPIFGYGDAERIQELTRLQDYGHAYTVRVAKELLGTPVTHTTNFTL